MNRLRSRRTSAAINPLSPPCFRTFGMAAWEADADYQSTLYRMRLGVGMHPNALI